MTIYISTGQGDWWTYDKDDSFMVLNTDDLNHVQRAEIEEEWGGLENDKFEQVIAEYGYQVRIEL